MSKPFMITKLRTAALALCLASTPVHAGNIDILPGGGDAMVAMLKGHSDTFVNAYLKMIQKEGLPTSGPPIRKMRAAMHTPVIARMEYTYVKDGRTYTRTYYGRSGPAMKVIYDRHTNGSASGGSSGDTSGSESGSRPYESTPQDVARDVEEELYYPREPSSVRAPNLPSEGSRVLASEVKTANGKLVNHASDAELKIFRKIEADIVSGEVTKGGKLLGYASKTLCDSCERASAAFAEEYDVDGTIYQLVEPVKDVIPTDPLLAESNASSVKLRNMRKDFASTHFDTKGVSAPIEDHGLDPARLKAIESEADETLAGGPCAD